MVGAGCRFIFYAPKSCTKLAELLVCQNALLGTTLWFLRRNFEVNKFSHLRHLSADANWPLSLSLRDMLLQLCPGWPHTECFFGMCTLVRVLRMALCEAPGNHGVTV